MRHVVFGHVYMAYRCLWVLAMCYNTLKTEFSDVTKVKHSHNQSFNWRCNSASCSLVSKANPFTWFFGHTCAIPSSKVAQLPNVWVERLGCLDISRKRVGEEAGETETKWLSIEMVEQHKALDAMGPSCCETSLQCF